ncbi:MAG: DUF945 family protein [Colwellia sp.]|nr:DUF945 family protein [Colwellia sp.]
MKKTLAIVIITILSIGIIAPKLVGNQFSTTLYSIAEKVNNTPGYTLEVQAINSQWFSTDASLVVSLDTAGLTGVPDTTFTENFSLVIEIKAEHGPFIFNEQSNLALISWTASVDGQALREHLVWAENTDFYQVNGLMGLLGDHNYQDKIAAFSTSDTPDMVSMIFSGYQGSGQYDGQEFSYKGGATDLTATAEAGDLIMKDLTINMQITATLEQIYNSGLYDSETMINFSSIKFNDNIDENINLTDLYVAASSFLDKEKQQANMQLSYGVKAGDINEYHVEDIALDIAVNNISGKFVKAYQVFSQTLGDVNAEDMQAKMLGFAQDNLLTLLSTEPQINITSLRGTFPEGKINATMHTSLVGVSTLPMPIEDQKFWLAHALINGKVTGDKAVIEFFAKQFMKKQLLANPQAQDMSAEEIDKMAAQQVPQMLDMLTQQGLLVATDSHYTTDFLLKDSQFKVNEKLIPLPF